MSLTAGSAHPKGESICVPSRHVKWTDQFVNAVDIEFLKMRFSRANGSARDAIRALAQIQSGPSC